MSCAPYPHRRGGPRNHIVTEKLSEKHIQAILAARNDASAARLPFNLFISIHWERLGLTDGEAAKATGRLIKLASDFARNRGGWLPWCWVRETGAGKGSHVHIALHCPAVIPIAKQLRRWLRNITSQPYRAGGVMTLRIGGRLDCYLTNPALHRINLEAVIAYMLKSAPQQLLDAYQIDRNHEPGGPIIGKRAARWQRARENASGPPRPCPASQSGGLETFAPAVGSVLKKVARQPSTPR